MISIIALPVIKLSAAWEVTICFLCSLGVISSRYIFFLSCAGVTQMFLDADHCQESVVSTDCDRSWLYSMSA